MGLRSRVAPMIFGAKIESTTTEMYERPSKYKSGGIKEVIRLGSASNGEVRASAFSFGILMSLDSVLFVPWLYE